MVEESEIMSHEITPTTVVQYLQEGSNPSWDAVTPRGTEQRLEQQSQGYYSREEVSSQTLNSEAVDVHEQQQGSCFPQPYDGCDLQTASEPELGGGCNNTRTYWSFATPSSSS